MIGTFSRFADDESASAAVEMALVLPFLLILMFGAFDVGNYFLSEHVLQKAVRDAARFAARLPMTDYTGCTVPTGGAAEQQTQRLARFGDPNGTGTARLAGWTADSMTTVTIACDTNTSHTYVNNGIYKDFPSSGEVPVVTISATVPYNTLFGVIGLGATTMNLNAQSQANVIGT
jgi:Flp pilus assembly protein TadG